MKTIKQQISDLFVGLVARHFSSKSIVQAIRIPAKDVQPVLDEMVDDGDLVLVKYRRGLCYQKPAIEKPADVTEGRYVPPDRPYEQTGPHWELVNERLADFRTVKSLFRSVP